MVSPTSPKATCWCGIGALHSVSDPGRAPVAAFSYLKQAIGFSVMDSFSDWNDDPDRTQTEVVEALRRAADIAEERGE